MTRNIDTIHFYANIENRTRDLTARVHEYECRGGLRTVHPFVITVANALIDLIGYSSDSTIDEYQNSIDPYVDAPNYAKAIAAAGSFYYNGEHPDPTSAEYRAYATEVDEYFAVYNHLSDAERKLITSVSDVWGLLDTVGLHSGTGDDLYEIGLREWFDRVMTFAESAK